jgi:hypothetical protein
MKSTLHSGNPLHPHGSDIIIQSTTLKVGKPVPEGWRVMTGNNNYSEIMRIVYRMELEIEAEAGT